MFHAAAIRRAVQEGRLAAQLESEVRKHFHRLPLEAVCRNGGWPDGDAISVFVGDGAVTVGDAWTVPFSLTFHERSVPGCGNSVDSSPRTADFTLRVFAEHCALELREAEPEPEF